MANWKRALSHLDRIAEVFRCYRIDRHPWRSTAGYLKVSDAQFPMIFSLRSGLQVELREYHDLVTAWVIFFRREYRYTDSVKTVLDLGTNIGCFSLSVADRLPEARVVALEPFPKTRARLLANIDRNPTLKPRITVWDFGVAKGAGERLMELSDGPSAGIGLLPDGVEPSVNAVEIRTRTFDQLIEDACALWKVDQIDFVKMDVEGSEFEAMAAASTESIRRVKALGMEYHPNGSKDALFADMARGGLKLDYDYSLYGNGVAHFSRR